MATLLQVARLQFSRRGYRQTTMASIAAAAGLTKRTLYLWHEDKEALFRACIIDGAEKFPVLPIVPGDDVGTALRDHLSALIRDLAHDDNEALGRLFLREGPEFPELAPIVERGYQDYIIEPLAAFLRQSGLEADGSTVATELLVAMALAPVHNAWLLGRAMPDDRQADEHAASVTTFFLARRGAPGTASPRLPASPTRAAANKSEI